MPSAKKRQGLIRVLTPGKITLYLEVLRKREDGYHDVRIAMAAISLYDTLTIELRPGQGTALTLDAREDLGPPERNLTRLAAEIFQQEFRREFQLEFQQASRQAPGEKAGEAAGKGVQGNGAPNHHVKMHLEKRIPAGAGLGGGSGNAAGVLSVLNRVAGHPLARSRLLELAARLGADVPFFIDPRPAWAEGVGERLRPLDGLPPLELLVIQPAFAISTGEAYALLNAPATAGTGGTAGPPLVDLQLGDWMPEGGVAKPAEVAAALHNRFEEVLLPRYPELAEIKRSLVDAGALGALLTGSGSAVFGIYADAAARDAALSALALIARDAGWRCFPCHTLEGHEYRDIP